MGKIIWDEDSTGYHPGLFEVRAAPPSEMAGLDLRKRISGPGAEMLGALERSNELQSVARMDGTSPVDEAPRGAEGLDPLGPGPMAARVFAPDSAPADPLARTSLIQFDPAKRLQPMLETLASDPAIRWVSPVPIRYITASAASADPVLVPNPRDVGNLKSISWFEVMDAKNMPDASALTVAILDTGFDPGHPDLKDKNDDYVWYFPDRNRSYSKDDRWGHGTHVAGTIGATSENGRGVNGICNARLAPFKIVSDTPVYDKDQHKFIYIVDPALYMCALKKCLRRGVDVLNLSIAGFKYHRSEARLIRNLLARGTVVVAGMGNDGPVLNRRAFPGALKRVIAVGGIDDYNVAVRDSSSGRHIALCAPGQGVWSTLPTYPGEFDFAVGPDGQIGAPNARKTHYFMWDGTSMATAHVSGAAALYLAKHGKRTPAQVRDALIASTDSVPEMGCSKFTERSGHGRLNLAKLLK